MPEISTSEWETFLGGYPDAHLLQTRAWGDLKASFGWEVHRVLSTDKDPVGAQVLTRRFFSGLSLAYIPKGPVIRGGRVESESQVRHMWQKLWPELDALCQRKGCVFLKVEPDLWESPTENQSPVLPPGFFMSPQAIQPLRTFVIDLREDEEILLARMKQKTRYNIRLALKRGVVVRPLANLEMFYELMEATGKRDEFEVHSLNYYRRCYELFHPLGGCELLVAEYAHEPLAALMIFARGKRAWYFYGASSKEHREWMPTYLLQWEAMRWARTRGCIEYDLWGVPDFDEEILEGEFTKRSDGLWGVYRFKRGFGGKLRRAMGAWDRPYKPIFYYFYRWWVGRYTR